MKATLILTLLLFCSANTQAKLIVSLENIDQLALERNEKAKIAQLQVKEAQLSVKSAQSELFPTIQIQGALKRSRQAPSLFPLPAGSPPIFNNWSREAVIGLTQPVFTFGRLTGGIKLAQSSLDLAQSQKDLTDAQIVEAAKTLYFYILFYKEYIDIAKDSYQNALKNKKALTGRVSFGRISQNQNLKMSADITSREPVVLEAEKNLQSMKLQLKSFLGLSPNEEISIMGDIHNAPSAIPSHLDLDSLAHINLLQNQLEMSKNLESIENKNYYPTLSFSLSYGRVGYYGEFDENNFLTQDNVNAGLLLTFDLPTGGKKSFQQSIAETKRRITELTLTHGKRDLESQISNLQQKYEILLKQIATNQKAVSVAKSSYNVALRAFRSGTVTQTELNDRELLLTQNKINLASNFLELQLINTQLEALKAKSTKES